MCLGLVITGVHRPAGQRPGEMAHVVLVVAAVHPDGVQLQDLAGEILVQPPCAALPDARIGTDRAVIVEIDQHGGMAHRCLEQVAEAAEDMRPHRLALIGAGDAAQEQTLHRDGDVVRPEADQPLHQRHIRCHRMLDAGGDLAACHGARCHGLCCHGLHGAAHGGIVLGIVPAGVVPASPGEAEAVSLLPQAGTGRQIAELGNRRAMELRQDEAARVRGDGVGLARPGAEAESPQRSDGMSGTHRSAIPNPGPTAALPGCHLACRHDDRRL
jgi:hypothetical protein